MLTKAAVVRNAEMADAWNVEQFDEDGSCLMAIFVGHDAEARALDYADRRNAEQWRATTIN
jgi:hypothetical protein